MRQKLIMKANRSENMNKPRYVGFGGENSKKNELIIIIGTEMIIVWYKFLPIVSHNNNVEKSIGRIRSIAISPVLILLSIMYIILLLTIDEIIVLTTT